MADRALAAASLLRAFLLDDADAGLLIIRQNGIADGTAGREARELVLAVTALANRSLLSANGADVARALNVVDQWIDSYADRATAADRPT
jgi:hypothetical protein